MSRRGVVAIAVLTLIALGIVVLRRGGHEGGDAVARADDAGAAIGDAEPSAAPDAAVVAAAPDPPDPDEQCFDCHPDAVDGFAKTGMGRSLYRPEDAPRIEDFDPEKATVKHEPTGLVYRAFIDDEGRWWQSESLPGTDYERRVRVRYIIGSGNHTRSYIGEVEGELVELPLTWYTGRGIWDMSPGYEGEVNFRFTRPIKPQCLFCHNDLTPARPGTVAGYARPLAEGISCVRCHGDGAAHVRARLDGEGPPPGEPDPTIFNPGRLPPARQRRLCEQCHLQGVARVLLEGRRWDAYDVREPLESQMSIYVPEGAGGREFSIASHGHRLSLSACAKKSGGRLSCTTCHDPHRPASTVSHREACLSCHQPDDCGDRHGTAPDAACARCHMPKGGTSDIPHVRFTDHFIRRRPEVAGEGAGNAADGTGLVDALASTRKGSDPKAELRRALAHLDVWRYSHLEDAEAHLPVAHRLLEAAVKRFPDDPRGWRGLGDVRAALRDAAGAAEAYARAAELAPDDPLILPDLAEAQEALGRFAEAEKSLRRAVELRPDYRVAWGNLANNLQRQGRFDEAEAAYARADELAPHLSLTANNRGHNALARGRPDEARKWFEEAVRRDPLDPMGPFNLAMLALEEGEAARARALLDELLARHEGFALARWLRGRAALALGDLGRAREDLERYIAERPNDPRGYVELSRVAVAAGELEDARAALIRGVVVMGPTPQLAMALQQLPERPPAPADDAP